MNGSTRYHSDAEMLWDLESFLILAAAFGEKTSAMPRVMGSLAGDEPAREIHAVLHILQPRLSQKPQRPLQYPI